MHRRNRSTWTRLGTALATVCLAASTEMPARAGVPSVGPAVGVASGLGGPEGITVLSNGTVVFGTEAGDVRRVEADGSTTLIVALGERLSGLAVTADDHVLALAYDAGNVWRVDPVLGSVVLQASGVPAANAAAVTRSGRILVSSSSAGTIVDVSSGSPVVVASGLGFPNGLAIGGDRRLYVAETGQSRISRMKLPRSGPLGPPETWATGVTLVDGIAFARAGVLMAVGFDQLWAVDPRTRAAVVVSTDPLLNWPSSIAFGRGRGAATRNTFLVNYGLPLGSGSTLVELPTNTRGARTIR